eukprot:13701743-Ditylum_brightwellii.AAC.1
MENVVSKDKLAKILDKKFAKVKEEAEENEQVTTEYFKNLLAKQEKLKKRPKAWKNGGLNLKKNK